MQTALAQTRLSGIATNLDYLRQILRDQNVIAGTVSTRYLETFHYTPMAFEIVDPGTYTTVQDYPGRTGYWDIGVPPSGPAIPVTATLTWAREWLIAPRAMSSAVASLTAPEVANVEACTPSISCLASLE